MRMACLHPAMKTEHCIIRYFIVARLLLVSVILSLLVNFAGAETLTVTARQAVVRAELDSKQAILITTPQGVTFTLLETRKDRHKIVLYRWV
jgi:hypothetical protein